MFKKICSWCLETKTKSNTMTPVSSNTPQNDMSAPPFLKTNLSISSEVHACDIHDTHPPVPTNTPLSVKEEDTNATKEFPGYLLNIIDTLGIPPSVTKEIQAIRVVKVSDDKSRMCFKLREKYPKLDKCICDHCSCLSGDSNILMANGSLKQMRHLVKGDKVAGGAAVIAMVVFHSKNPVTLVSCNGVMITPYHPVRIDGVWRFPIDVVGPGARMTELNTVYNLVLDSGHVVIADGVECVMLGHDFEDPVVAHPYFGKSRKVIKDLQQHPDWEFGYLVYFDVKVERDDEGLVCRLS